MRSDDDIDKPSLLFIGSCLYVKKGNQKIGTDEMPDPLLVCRTLSLRLPYKCSLPLFDIPGSYKQSQTSFNLLLLDRWVLCSYPH